MASTEQERHSRYVKDNEETPTYIMLRQMLDHGSVEVDKMTGMGSYMRFCLLEAMTKNGWCIRELLYKTNSTINVFKYTLTQAGRQKLIDFPFIPLDDERALAGERSAVKTRVQCCVCKGVVVIRPGKSLWNSKCSDCQ